PGAPSVTSVARQASQTVRVSFGAPGSTGGSAITDYDVEYSTNGSFSAGSGTFFEGGTTTSGPVDVTGLTNGTTYYFRVRATNAAGDGSWSSVSSGGTPFTTPGAPTLVTGTAGDGLVSVAWTNPNDGGSAITDYDVEYSTNGSFSAGSGTFFEGDTTTSGPIDVTGLTNGTTYYFRVRATNIVGNGDWSAIGSTSVTPRTVPDAPSSPSVAREDSGKIRVTITAPDDGGSAITDYDIEYSTNGSFAAGSGTFFEGGVGPGLVLDVDGLLNGTTYYFRVRATNGAGDGDWSPVSLGAFPFTTPGAPSVTSVARQASQTVRVSFGAPVSDGGSAITDYDVEYSTNGSFTAGTGTLFSDGTTTSGPIDVTGLTNGTTYYFRVRATNAAGDSDWSSVSSGATPYTTPDEPTGVSGTPGDGQVTVSWTAPVSNGGSAVTGYVVTVSSDGSYASAGAGSCASAVSSTSTSCTVTGLSNGTAYTFKVAAVNAAGTGSESTPSSSVTPRTTPGAPSVTSVARQASQTVRVSFGAPGSNGGSAITDYDIEYSTNGSFSAGSGTLFEGGTTTSGPIDVTGLTNGTTYYFRVRATNAAGNGDWSSVSSGAVPYTTPGAPSVTSVARQASQTVRVSFGAPGSTGGSAITDYDVEYSTNGSFSAGSGTFFEGGTTTSGPVDVTGLTNGTTYYFRVRATNAAGDSDWSSVSSGATPYTTPSAPTGVAGVAGNASVTVSWTAPSGNGGSAVTGYVVTVSSGGSYGAVGAGSCTSAGSSTSTSCTVTGLSNGTAYTFKVAAINAAGTGSESTPSSSVTPTAPAPPTPPVSPPSSPTPGSGTVEPVAPGVVQAKVSVPEGDVVVEISGARSLTGVVTVTSKTGTPPEDASGFVLPGGWLEISTTLTDFSSVELCVPYNRQAVASAGLTDDQLRLFHWKNGVRTDITVRLDTAAGLVCGKTDHFSPFAIGALKTTRVAGPDRYATAVAVSGLGFDPGVAVAYVVTGEQYPDAMAAGVQAGRQGGPVLLSRPSVLPQVTKAELQRLRPRRVVVVGGQAALSEAVLVAIQNALPGTPVERVAGVDRYETAAKLSQRSGTRTGGTVYLGSGLDVTSALASATAAGRDGAPLLLVPGTSTRLPRSVTAELARLKPSRVVVVGGTNLISSALTDQVGRLLPRAEIVDVPGSNAYDVAALLSATFAPGQTIYVATGAVFADGLAGGALATSKRLPVVVVPPTGTLPGSVALALATLKPSKIVVLGGPSAVSYNVENQLAKFLPA
ncbi:MAG: hypothetical protein B7C54_01600, partial [Acidimicrobiales bacterium mtb01]